MSFYKSRPAKRTEYFIHRNSYQYNSIHLRPSVDGILNLNGCKSKYPNEWVKWKCSRQVANRSYIMTCLLNNNNKTRNKLTNDAIDEHETIRATTSQQSVEIGWETEITTARAGVKIYTSHLSAISFVQICVRPFARLPQNVKIIFICEFIFIYEYTSRTWAS